VFEELDEDRATRLLGARSDAEIAEYSRGMRADTPRTRSPSFRRAGDSRFWTCSRRAAHQGADPDGVQPHQRGRS